MGPWFTLLAAAVEFAALVAAFVCGVMFERGRLGRKQSKACFEVPCPGFEEVRLDVVPEPPARRRDR
jgi:hypothetical protein